MKIALPLDEDKKSVCVSFGRAPEYMLIDSETGERETLANPGAEAAGGAGIKAAQFLVNNNVDVIISPRCGENAAQVLEGANIKMYKSSSADIEAELKKYNEGTLECLSDIHPGLHNHR